MLGLTYYAPHLGIISLIIAGLIYLYIKRQSNGSEAIGDLEAMIQSGVTAFLKREYLILIIFIIILFLSLGLLFGQWHTSIAFLTGAFLSMAAGFIGLNASTRGISRTAEAANISGQTKALTISYYSGSVMGLAFSGLGLLGLGLWFSYYGSDPAAIRYLNGFALGTCTIAFFTRVGGGIFSKAAYLGTDLAWEIEAGIPKNDPRNPGVIAYIVGENVGNITGMGADIFDSFICTMIACIALGTTMPVNTPEGLNAVFKEYQVLDDLNGTTLRIKFMAMPLIIAMAGMVSSFIGVLSIKVFQKDNPANALSYTTMTAAGTLIILTVVVTIGLGMPWSTLLATLSGLMCGIFLGLITEHSTSGPSIRRIAAQSKTGPGSVIIAGLASGMRSIYLPIIFISVSVLIGYMAAGTYGIGLSAVGMLATVGATMAINSYGPIADNAAEIAELAGMGQETRMITQRLDSLGDTTTALGKGFAIGSAVLTSLALFMAFARIADLDGIDINNPFVIVGAFVGAIVPAFCASLTMTAIGEAASRMIKEVQRQYRLISGLIEGKEGVRPDPKRCVSNVATSVFMLMIAPGLIVLLAPVAVGFLLGKEALGGMLLGSIIMGAFLAFFMTNSGDALGNAKKYIEDGNLGGKGSDNHKVVMIVNPVGYVFKDASGPSMNILIKIMIVVALLLSPILPTIGVLTRI